MTLMLTMIIEGCGTLVNGNDPCILHLIDLHFSLLRPADPRARLIFKAEDLTFCTSTS